MNLLLLLLFLGCSQTGEELSRDDISMYNDNEIYNPIIFISREDIQIIKASSKYLVKNGNEDALLTGNVLADFYNESGQHMSVLSADSAEINQRTNNLLAKGNVSVKSDSGYSLFANSILWDNQYKIIESNDSVMFTTTQGDTMYGIGFESDMDLTEWKIYRPVGVVQRDIK